jgi:hypothetical protein
MGIFNTPFQKWRRVAMTTTTLKGARISKRYYFCILLHQYNSNIILNSFGWYGVINSFEFGIKNATTFARPKWRHLDLRDGGVSPIYFKACWCVTSLGTTAEIQDVVLWVEPLFHPEWPAYPSVLLFCNVPFCICDLPHTPQMILHSIQRWILSFYSWPDES